MYDDLVAAREHNRANAPSVGASGLHARQGPAAADGVEHVPAATTAQVPMSNAELTAALTSRNIAVAAAATREDLLALYNEHVEKVEPVEQRDDGARAVHVDLGLSEEEQLFANTHGWHMNIAEWNLNDRGIGDVGCALACALMGRGATSLVYLQSNAITDKGVLWLRVLCAYGWVDVVAVGDSVSVYLLGLMSCDSHKCSIVPYQ